MSTLVARFWAKVEKRGPGECWPWLASKTNLGYGKIGAGGHDGPMLWAARVSWEIANNKPFPEGKVSCHSCDHPWCVNPAHIWPGTTKENLQDAARKGIPLGFQISGLSGTYAAAKTHCKNGHAFTPENTILVLPRAANRGIHRRCRECRKRIKREWAANRRAQERAVLGARLS